MRYILLSALEPGGQHIRVVNGVTGAIADMDLQSPSAFPLLSFIFFPYAQELWLVFIASQQTYATLLHRKRKPGFLSCRLVMQGRSVQCSSTDAIQLLISASEIRRDCNS